MNDQLTEVIEFDDDAAPTATYPIITEEPVAGAPAVDATPTGPSLVPLYPVAEPYLGTAHLPPVPEPPVNTFARPVTIVWGFILMAIGILAITMAAGAAVDLGLALVWLPAIAGTALIVGAILAATRRNRNPVA